MMSGIKRFSELQVDVRFHEVHCNRPFVHSIPWLHFLMKNVLRHGREKKKIHGCTEEMTPRREKKVYICVCFCKLRAKMYFLFGIYWHHSTLVNLVTAN